MAKTKNYCMATRAQVIGLLTAGILPADIAAVTGVPAQTCRNWWKKALKRGFDPQARPLLVLDEHVVDGLRSGRPSTQDDKQDDVSLIDRENEDDWVDV